jgi:hypothetical protein
MRFYSGGEIVEITSDLPWTTRIIERNVGTEAAQAPDGRPSVRLCIDRSTAPFSSRALRVLTRGAYASDGRVILINAGGSGFDLQVDVSDDVLDVTARYRPGATTRAANLALSDRFGLLACQVLVHYPVLWRAGWRGRVPLHASVLRAAGVTPLLAGPGGVGKSTILSAALRDGAVATADNLCCADETTCYGLIEPLRTDAQGAHGSLTSHGRVSRPFGDREPALTPDRLVVLERGSQTSITRISPAEATRTLVAGTYAAGELRRYWAMSATLSLGTGLGPVHPPVEGVAAAMAARVPCVRVRVGDGQIVTTDQLCDVNLGTVGTESAWATDLGLIP